ncbi:MAG TPA: glycine/sarcosine/betaine reductase selenoprotein B family protein [Vicinamibacterales bacterium]|nr:glycine/sarcosine/betaine reductase selenoprotein B family protein [Vicinamibacterales bacterium]
MAKLSDLPLKYRLFLRAYRFRHVDWSPGAVLSKPLCEARVAAIASAGYYLPDQRPFDSSIRGGDTSYRVIPDHTNLDTLQIGNRSGAFDSSGIETDKDLALPVDRLHDLERLRQIGSVAPRHFSVQGSITAPGRLVSRTAPEIAAMLRDDRVDAVLLAPV